MGLSCNKHTGVLKTMIIAASKESVKIKMAADRVDAKQAKKQKSAEQPAK